MAQAGGIVLVLENSNYSRTRTNFLFLDPSAGAWDLPAHHIAGVAFNPMNQPYLSGLAELDADTRRRLLNQYETQRSNPCAVEIAA